jgi:Tol biopolymer transport system component
MAAGMAVLTAALLACRAATATQRPSTATAPAPSMAALLTPPTPAGPDWSRKGRIAFVVGHDDGTESFIETIAADGTDERRLEPNLRTTNELPEWIPGRDRLVFDSTRTGIVKLFAINGDGSGVEQLTAGPTFDGAAGVSPDGSTIAYDSGLNDEPAFAGIFVVNADGSHPRRLLDAPTPPDFDSQPEYSPDGTRLAFIRKRSQLPGHGLEAVFIVDSAGRAEPRQLTDWTLDVASVRWSPDSQWLIFSDNAENGPLPNLAVNCWRIRPDGSGLEQITDEQAGHFTSEPAYSPDGERLVVLHWDRPDSYQTMWTMDPDGGNRTLIYTGPAGWYIEAPVWANLPPM